MNEARTDVTKSGTSIAMGDVEIFGEVEAQIDALQEIAAELNGEIRPEITIRMRPNLTWWLGCQCGTKFISGSGVSFNDAHRAFFAALNAERHGVVTK